MILETCAKVNLTLEMLFRRDDGYTELASIFQAIDLCDRITISPADTLALTVSGAPLPSDSSNLCWRAAALLADHLNRRPDVQIELIKRIPSGAGLGGGSGNAAGVLAALNVAWQGGLELAELSELGSRLGSDVPFFLVGGAAHVTGRGERVDPLPSLPDAWRLVIVEPRESVSTAAVYRDLGDFRAAAGANTSELAARLRAGTLADWPSLLINDLEQPAATVGAVLADDRDRLAELDLSAFLLSGSGGAWFVPVARDGAEDLAGRIRRAWPERSVWVTRPAARGWRWLAEPEIALW